MIHPLPLFDRDCVPTYTLHGYSPWSAPAILEAACGRPTADAVPGDFVLVAKGRRDNQPCEAIVTSPVAAIPYFAYCGGRPHTRRTAQQVTAEGQTIADSGDPVFVHGLDVFSVLDQCPLPWRWNRRALLCLLTLEHTLGEDSLHQDIFHVPAGTLLVFHRGLLQRHTYFDRSALFHDIRPSSMAEAVARLDAVCREMTTGQPIVSLSSGFDSRLLLAAQLHHGQRPLTVTMGFSDSTDRVVASAIAARLGLEQAVVELEYGDYLRYARDIVRLTSGSKPAKHWHTYIYVRKAGLPDSGVHFVGTGGLFAKLYGTRIDLARPPLFLLNIAAKGLEHVRRNELVRLLLGRGALSCLREVTQLADSLCQAGDTEESRMKEFKTFETVRHFQGNGNALYRAVVDTRSPFLDIRWMRSVRGLPRTDLLGCNFHRAAIASLYPKLLEFPCKGEPRVARRASPWSMFRGAESKPYRDTAGLVKTPVLKQLLIDSPVLELLVRREHRIRLAAAQNEEQSLLLLTFHFLLEHLRERGIDIERLN